MKKRAMSRCFGLTSGKRGVMRIMTVPMETLKRKTRKMVFLVGRFYCVFCIPISVISSLKCTIFPWEHHTRPDPS